MPLSEYEQRVLEQMERALTSDDPRLANTLQSPKRHPVVRFVLAGVAVVVGLFVLVLGVALTLIWLGVVGFLVMFAGVIMALYGPRRRSGPEGTVDAEGNVKASPVAAKSNAKRPSKQGFFDRLEARWDRRREQGDR